MSENNQNPPGQSDTGTRIVGINRDKTRKTGGSNLEYHVYLELSDSPPPAWGSVFEEEWKLLNPAEPGLWHACSVDRSFLVIRCPLKEIAAKHLPVLHKAVAAANRTYGQSLREQATERELRENVWKQERKNVDDMADSLHFEKSASK